MPNPGQLSPDGRHMWNGKTWIAATSPTGAEYGVQKTGTPAQKRYGMPAPGTAGSYIPPAYQPKLPPAPPTRPRALGPAGAVLVATGTYEVRVIPG